MPVTTPESRKAARASVYLGQDRKAALEEKYKELGYDSISEFFCTLVDLGLEFTLDDLRQLRAVAILRKKKLSALLAEFVRRAVDSR